MGSTEVLHWLEADCNFCPFDGAEYEAKAGKCLICGNLRAKVLIKSDDGPSGDDIVDEPKCLVVPSWSKNSFLVEKIDSTRCKINVWQKVLYKRQPFPDDHTDAKRFLDCLMQNAQPAPFGYWRLVTLTARITQPLCIVIIHIATWRGVHQQPARLSATTLTGVDFLLISLYWYVTWLIRTDSKEPKPISELRMTAFKRITVIIGCLKVLSPLIQTLTQSFSHDTVIFLTTCMFTLHIISFNYQRVLTPSFQDGTVALNASIVGTTVLVSRLRDADEVFAVLLFGVISLVLSIPIRRSIFNWWPLFHDVILTSFLISISLILFRVFVDNTVLMISYIAALGSIIFLGPALFLLSAQYKSNLSGPWDVPEIVADRMTN